MLLCSVQGNPCILSNHHQIIQTFNIMAEEAKKAAAEANKKTVKERSIHEMSDAEFYISAEIEAAAEASKKVNEGDKGKESVAKKAKTAAAEDSYKAKMKGKKKPKTVSL